MCAKGKGEGKPQTIPWSCVCVCACKGHAKAVRSSAEAQKVGKSAKVLGTDSHLLTD